MNVKTPHQRPISTLVIALTAVLVVFSHGCIIDSLIGTLAGKEHNVPPPANPTSVNGTFEGQAGATLNSYGSTRISRPDLVSSVQADDSYTLSVPGDENITNLTTMSTAGATVYMVIIPNIPAATSVYEPGLVVDMANQYPLMNPGDPVTTAVVLLIDGKTRLENGNLGSLDPSAVDSLITDFTAAIEDGQEDFVAFMDMVTRLLEAADTAPPIPVFVPPSSSLELGSSLNQEFLDGVEVDYTGDGVPDTTTVAYEDAIGAAVGEVEVDVCIDPDMVRVVFQVDFQEPLLDGNCQERDPAKWLSSQPPGGTPNTINPDFNMYFVGGTNEYLIRCEDNAEYPAGCADDGPGACWCATQEDIDFTNVTMHGDASPDFQPNIIRMFDDGTNGDTSADDGIWSLALDLPRGIRVGYKYTWSQGGVDWTGTEEWPGNTRLLELIDVDGDGIVTRFDNFGDEATNKDRQNLRSTARGGVSSGEGLGSSQVWSCSGEGTIAEADPEAANCCRGSSNGEDITGCADANRDEEIENFGVSYFDNREIPVDLDGDCLLDGFPSPGPNTPITTSLDDPRGCYEAPDWLIPPDDDAPEDSGESGE